MSPSNAEFLKAALRQGKGDSHLLCEAPSGPLRQEVAVTFSHGMMHGRSALTIQNFSKLLSPPALM